MNRDLQRNRKSHRNRAVHDNSYRMSRLNPNSNLRVVPVAEQNEIFKIRLLGIKL